MAVATGLPDTAIPRPASLETNFSLHATARLVDVGVLAYDKKGNPVADLKLQDFEIYDNGRKQVVRLFSRARSASEKEVAMATDQRVFSNRHAGVTHAKPGSIEGEGNVTILLIDAGNLAWADLSYARGEMLRFLGSLPADERVGLYVMKADGFQVLEEGTSDHALLASKLSRWMPSPGDLARAQEEERRNRQQMETVRSMVDLQDVNGDSNTAPVSGVPVDPQLRDFGSNPGRDALSILVVVSRHLAALPGHKNLVWVSSDNVLADWSDKAIGADKGSKHVEEFALRAQEAMNDAHVAVYSLDASQLETSSISAAVQSRNVEMDPATKDNPFNMQVPTDSQGVNTPSPDGIDPRGGRNTAEMQQDLHPIQGPVLELADATGGRALRRGVNITMALDGVIADGRAAYLLSFTPDAPADDQYHLLTVKLATQSGVRLRYRTGYLYSKEPATFKERFRQAVWQPLDVNEISVSATPVIEPTGSALELNIETNDLALKQQDERWLDKLDIFLVQRDDEGLHARVTGQRLGLTLKPATYQELLAEGISFEQLVEKKQDTGSVRIVVVDENSGRMGSVTVPVAALKSKP